MVRTGHRGRAAAEQTPRLRARERQKRSSPNERQQQSSMLDSLQSEVRPETEDYSKDARATRGSCQSRPIDRSQQIIVTTRPTLPGTHGWAAVKLAR
jgi:hypothetical protein